MTTSGHTDSLGTFPGRDGLELAYRWTGEGRPIVLLHGFTGNGVQFLRHGPAAALAGHGYRVIVPDLRGHGDSSRPHDPAAADWLAQSGADPHALLHVLDTFVETPAAALAEITTPMLVVAGDTDERQAEDLAAALPGARYVQVPGNHFTALPSQELEAAILAFLAREP